MSGDKLYVQCRSCKHIYDPETDCWMAPGFYDTLPRWRTDDVCHGPLCDFVFFLESYKDDYVKVEAALERAEIRKLQKKKGPGDKHD